jgi:hypothetical protein
MQRDDQTRTGTQMRPFRDAPHICINRRGAARAVQNHLPDECARGRPLHGGKVTQPTDTRRPRTPLARPRPISANRLTLLSLVPEPDCREAWSWRMVLVATISAPAAERRAMGNDRIRPRQLGSHTSPLPDLARSDRYARRGRRGRAPARRADPAHPVMRARRGPGHVDQSRRAIQPRGRRAGPD